MKATERNASISDVVSSRYGPRRAQGAGTKE